MKRDRFQTAGRIAEALEHVAPKDPREEMRPITAAEAREREFRQVVARREFGRYVADRAITIALCRILWPDGEWGKPTDLDYRILTFCDAEDFETNATNTSRLLAIRDAIRSNLPGNPLS